MSLLRDRDLSAGDIAESLGRPRPGVSHHLASLLQEGVVTCHPRGPFRYYRLEVPKVLPAWDAYVRRASTSEAS